MSEKSIDRKFNWKAALGIAFIFSIFIFIVSQSNSSMDGEPEPLRFIILFSAIAGLFVYYILAFFHKATQYIDKRKTKILRDKSQSTRPKFKWWIALLIGIGIAEFMLISGLCRSDTGSAGNDIGFHIAIVLIVTTVFCSYNLCIMY